MEKAKSGSSLESRALAQITELGLPLPESQFRFAPPRKWLFDFAYPDLRIAIEVEGGTYGKMIKCLKCGSTVMARGLNGRLYPLRIGGRHNRGEGFEKDVEKYNAAELLGWHVFRVTGKMIRERKAGKLVESIFWKESEEVKET